MGSESDCLLGQFERTLWISDSEAGLKAEKSGGVVEGEGECGDDVVLLLSRDRRSLDILSVKKEAKQSCQQVRYLGYRKVRVTVICGVEV